MGQGQRKVLYHHVVFFSVSKQVYVYDDFQMLQSRLPKVSKWLYLMLNKLSSVLMACAIQMGSFNGDEELILMFYILFWFFLNIH